MYSFLIVGSLILFIISEKTFLHFSRTARRAFWFFLSCAVGVWLVKWLQSVEGVGMVWVFLSAVLAASVVEDEVAKMTGLTAMNIEATQRLRAATRTPEAQGKAERIMDIVASITRGKGYTAGTKQLVSRVSGTTKRLQRALHSVLSLASPQELNYILCAVNVPATVEVADHHTMHLLVKEKLPLLCTVARAALVDGIQKLGSRYRPQRQLWVRDIIVCTHGLDLTHFKAYIDDGGDYHTMYKLVYNDLQGEAQRDVLEHLKIEGEAVAAVVQGSGAGAPPGAVLKVLSDIDDTVFSSGDSFPAGVDARYPRKCYYPGAIAFYAALDRCFAQRHASLLQMVSTVGVSAAAADASDDDDSDDDDVDGDGDDAINLQKEGKIDGEEEEEEVQSPPQKLPPPPITSDNTDNDRLFGMQDPSSSMPPTPFASKTVQRPHLRLPSTTSATLDAPPAPPLDQGIFFEGFSPRAESPQPERRAYAPFVHHQEGSNLVFLSARPESYKGLTESESYRKYFQPPVLRGDLDTSPTMLLGSLDSGPRALMNLVAGKWMPTTDTHNPKTAAAALYQTLAAKKLSRFREYAAIYPEAAFVFVGDNGQGDVLCAEILYTTAVQAAAASSRPSQLLASFIHRVVPPSSTLSMIRTAKGSKDEWMAAWQQRHIFFHRSHAGMAVKAYHLGFLDEEALSLVISTAVVDFRRIVGRYGGRHAGRNLAKAAKHLNADIAAANSTLPTHLHVPLVQLPGEGGGPPPAESQRAPSVALSDVTGLVPLR